MQLIIVSSQRVCPVTMRWNSKEHFVISNQELHEEGRELMEVAVVKNEKPRLPPHEMRGSNRGRPVRQKNLIC